MADDVGYAKTHASKADAVQYINCNLRGNVYETANNSKTQDIELNFYTTLQKTKTHNINKDDITSVYEKIYESEGHAPTNDVNQYYVNVDANNYTSLDNIKPVISAEDKSIEKNKNKPRAMSCKWSVRFALILGTIVVAGAVAVPVSLYYSCSLSNTPCSCDESESSLSSTLAEAPATAVTSMHDVTRSTSTRTLTQTHEIARSTQDSWTLSLTTISELATLSKEQETTSQTTTLAIEATLEQDPIISAHGFGFVQQSFVCLPYHRIACMASHTDGIFVHVQWLVGSITIATEHRSDNLPISEPAIITTNDLLNAGHHIGITVTCRVRPRLHPNSILGLPRESHFFIGAVPRQTYFSFSETDGPKDYVLDLTIPYIHATISPSLDCDSINHESHMALTADNMLSLMLLLPESINGVQECHEDGVVFQRPESLYGCAVPQNNATELRVSISVNPNLIYFPNRDMALQLSTPESNMENRFWENYHLPRAQVAFQPYGQSISGKICSLEVGNLRTFDQLRYEAQLNGLFVLYRHESFPFRVEVSLEGNPALPCDIAVRGEGDIFLYDPCTEGPPSRISVYDCTGNGLEITQVVGGYKINLPTGTIVQIRNNVISIVASIFDWGKTEGLCGRLNDNQSDDLVHGDVTGTALNPNEFVNSWRIPLEEALYFGHTGSDRAYSDVEFCSCTDDLDNPGAICSMSRAPQYCLDNDHPLVSSAWERCSGVLQRKRRSLFDIGEDPRD